MKQPLVAAMITAAFCLPLHARTWTSADGAKTFTGDFRTYDKDTGEVTVILRNGHKVAFDKSKLSEEDIAFVEENAGSAKAGGDSSGSLEDQVVGAMVAKTKLHRLEGKSFKKAILEKAPDYYILYFSASW